MVSVCSQSTCSRTAENWRGMPLMLCCHRSSECAVASYAAADGSSTGDVVQLTSAAPLGAVAAVSGSSVAFVTEDGQQLCVLPSPGEQDTSVTDCEEGLLLWELWPLGGLPYHGPPLASAVLSSYTVDQLNWQTYCTVTGWPRRRLCAQPAAA